MVVTLRCLIIVTISRLRIKAQVIKLWPLQPWVLTKSRLSKLRFQCLSWLQSETMACLRSFSAGVQVVDWARVSMLQCSNWLVKHLLSSVCKINWVEKRSIVWVIKHSYFCPKPQNFLRDLKTPRKVPLMAFDLGWMSTLQNTMRLQSVLLTVNR